MADRPALDASLELWRGPVRGESLRCKIVNTGADLLVCGLGYQLEREVQGAWLLMNPGMWFAAVGFTVAPGEDHKLLVEIPNTAPSGQYRVKTQVSSAPPPYPPKKLDICALVQIR